MLDQWLYLFSLVFSISGLMFLDYRYKIAFWLDTKRASLTVLTAMLVFIMWDLIGIELGIFFKGESQYVLPLEILPEFPIEELFFLFLLCYVTLIIYRGAGRWRRISS